MEVRLIEHTKLSNAVIGGRTCWDSFHKGGCYSTPTDIISEEDKNFLERIINKNKHKSIAEHLVYIFKIDGISRACLQELARHRIASLSVESTRYTLKKLRDEECNIDDFVVATGNEIIDRSVWTAINQLQQALRLGISNDIAKYMLPEAFKTSLVWTINARSLQNFLSLRLSNNALWEIRQLAREVYMNLPDKHKYLFPVPPEDETVERT